MKYLSFTKILVQCGENTRKENKNQGTEWYGSNFRTDMTTTYIHHPDIYIYIHEIFVMYTDLHT